MTVLIAAEAMDSFREKAMPGWRIHQLSGDRKDCWSISVSGNWRVTFLENDGRIEQLTLEDYH